MDRLSLDSLFVGMCVCVCACVFVYARVRVRVSAGRARCVVCVYMRVRRVRAYAPVFKGKEWTSRGEGKKEGRANSV